MSQEHARGSDGRPEYAVIREFQAQLLRSDPFSRFGTHAVGIGRKVRGGQRTDSLALRFYVPCKLPRNQLPPERRIPTAFRYFSADLGRDVEVPTDVIESAPPQLHSPVDLGGVLRPVPGGASCSSITYFGTGTIGGWVWDRTDDTIVMLSNQHVFGNTVGGAIIQPGTSDGGEFPEHRVGEVKRSIPLTPFEGRPVPNDCNFVDAAVGEADSSELFDLTVEGVGPAVYETGVPSEGDTVEKTGQVTGHTVGVVIDADVAVSFPYPEGEVVICDSFMVEPVDSSQNWATNGDSGSLVFLQGPAGEIKPALGLHFGGGGTPPNNWGVECKITNVFAALDLAPLCDAGCAAFLDALFSEEAGGEVAPPSFTSRERARRRSGRFHSGLALDLQGRLLESRRGRALVRFVNRHRDELLTLVVRHGDTRRSMVAALRPLLAGAVITSEILDRRLDSGDIEGLERLGRVLDTAGSEQLSRSIQVLRRMLEGGEGRSLADLLGLQG
ncbi:MAG: hypothetical protein ACOC5M_02860 [Chloroflexota bacterium]